MTLTYNVNMFEIDETDETFVLSLIRKLRKYPVVDDADDDRKTSPASTSSQGAGE